MYVGQARCLDLFSGSGALGFEAASRGASHVDMIELDARAYQQLQQNATVLKAEVCHLHPCSAQQFLSQKHKPYHLVFIDPPFQADLWQHIVGQLIESNLLVDGARVYVEMPAKSEAFDTPQCWKLLKEKRAGDVKYCLFEHLDEEESV
jgi:16S rRNA (guanine966-N2)-methyltransferase